MKKRKKKGALLLGGLALTALAGMAVTLGYFTSKETVTNTFTVGSLEIGLEESEWDPEQGDGQSMCPGDSFYKNPTLKNLGEDGGKGQPCYARMVVHICDQDGNLIEDPEALDLIKQTMRYDSGYTGTYSTKGEGKEILEGRIPGYSLADLEEIPSYNPLFEADEGASATNKLVYLYSGSDGSGVLQPGEEAPLFTNIVIPTDWTQTEIEKVGTFQLVVKAEAIQISGFSGRGDALVALDQEMTS